MGKGGRCVGLTTLPPSCVDCLEIREPQLLGTFWSCPGVWWDCFTFYRRGQTTVSLATCISTCLVRLVVLLWPTNPWNWRHYVPAKHWHVKSLTAHCNILEDNKNPCVVTQLYPSTTMFPGEKSHWSLFGRGWSGRIDIHLWLNSYLITGWLYCTRLYNDKHVSKLDDVSWSDSARRDATVNSGFSIKQLCVSQRSNYTVNRYDCLECHRLAVEDNKAFSKKIIKRFQVAKKWS